MKANQTTATASPIINAMSSTDAMDTVEEMAGLLVKVGMETQLTDAMDFLEWIRKDGSIVSETATDGLYIDYTESEEGKEVKCKSSGLKPAYATKMEVYAILADMGMLLPTIEDAFDILLLGTKGEKSTTGKTEFIVFNEAKHSVRLDWFRNAFRKLAGIHRPDQGPQPWNVVFSGNKGKSRTRRVAMTAGGSKARFDIKAALKAKKDGEKK